MKKIKTTKRNKIPPQKRPLNRKWIQTNVNIQKFWKKHRSRNQNGYKKNFSLHWIDSKTAFKSKHRNRFNYLLKRVEALFVGKHQTIINGDRTRFRKETSHVDRRERISPA